MLISLHKQHTTPRVQAELQASTEPAWVLAERHGTTEQTVWTWRHRDSIRESSHTPHRLPTTLMPAQEVVAVALWYYQTSGMVEQFDGRIVDVLQSHRFRRGEDLESTLKRYVKLYDVQLPQPALKARLPMQAMGGLAQAQPSQEATIYPAQCDS